MAERRIAGADESGGNRRDMPVDRLQGSPRGCILLVTSHCHPAAQVMDYVLSVADRLGSKVILVHVDPHPFLHEQSLLASSARVERHSAADEFRKKARSRGVEFEYIKESGKIGKIVGRLCHIVKRVEFVIIDQGIKMEEVASDSPVPVFSVVHGAQNPERRRRSRQTRTFFHGELCMKTTSRRTYLARTLIFGAMTAALYAMVFTNADAIMQYWTKGGIYALLPVATVFVFSYAHGSFTGNFWSALGIEGSKASSQQQPESQPTVSDQRRRRPDTRPRVQAS